MRGPYSETDGGGGNRTPTSGMQNLRAPITTTPPGPPQLRRRRGGSRRRSVGHAELAADRAAGVGGRVDVDVVAPRAPDDLAQHRARLVLHAAGPARRRRRALEQRDDDRAGHAAAARVDV